MAVVADRRAWSGEEVRQRFRSAYFSLFSVPDPQTPDVPIVAELPFPFSLLQRIPNFPQLLRGVKVNEAPLRFSTTLGESACQLLATNTVGDPIATVHIDWTPIPWDYPANPDANPPAKILNPLVSQRFEMLNGEFRFNDSSGTGIHGFGAGRTFPRFPQGLSLRIGAVINVLEGFGEFAGRHGLLVVNGMISPPDELDLNIMARILDPSGDLLAQSPLPPINPRPFPDPDATFLVFESEPDPARPPRLVRSPDGQLLGIELHELLRPLDLDFAVVSGSGPGSGLKSWVKSGELVGRGSRMLHLPITPGVDGSNPLAPVPVWTEGGEFVFEANGRRIGSVRADLVEGRGFATEIQDGGTASTLYRLGGFGPITGGSGQFEGADGLLSMNALLSFDPLSFSNLYVFRFADKAGRYRRIEGSTP